MIVSPISYHYKTIKTLKLVRHIHRSRGSLQKVQDPLSGVGAPVLHGVFGVGRHLHVGGIARDKVAENLALNNLTLTPVTDHSLPLGVGLSLFL